MEQCQIDIVMDDGRVLSTLYTQPGVAAMIAAKGLSVGFPKQEVRVYMFSRLRRVYKNNEVMKTYSIHRYFTNPDPQDVHEWNMLGADEH